MRNWCFPLFHKWTKWSDKREACHIYGSYSHLQERKCERCNRADHRWLK